MTEEKPWSETEVSRLRRFVAEGQSIAEIGRQLERSKNSVGSKMNQIGLESAFRHSNTKGNERPFHSAKPVIAPARRCTWIAAKDFLVRARQGDETIFCGKPTVRGSSFCEVHHKRCWVANSRKTVQENKSRLI